MRPQTANVHAAALLPLLAILPAVAFVADQKCYVCIPGRRPRTNSRGSSRGRPARLRGVTEPAVKKCPPQYRGCLTQYNGEKVTRSCGELNITTCQMANGVYYCYCKDSLCNGPENDRAPPDPEDEEHQGASVEKNKERKEKGGGDKGGGQAPPPDDEDTMPSEGSGAGAGHHQEESNRRRTSGSSTPAPRQAPAAGVASVTVASPLALVAAVLYLVQ